MLYVKSTADAPFVESAPAKSEPFTITTEQQVATVTDVLTQTTFGVSGTNYTPKTDIKKGASGIESDAVYAAQLAGDKGSIQLRSSNSNSGIVTTASGGNARKIVVEWNADTATARILDIYGSDTPFTAATELYNNGKGTKIGSIKRSETTLEIEGNYPYIGFRSNSGAMYITKIEITYEK